MNTLTRNDRAAAAGALARGVALDSPPRHRRLHMLPAGERSQLFVVEGSRLYDIDAQVAAQLGEAIASAPDNVDSVLAQLGVEAWPTIDSPPSAPPVKALSLAVAQKCNLACSYCYAEQGTFGEAPSNMPLETAVASIDLLLSASAEGDRVNIAFMGGEPLRNRAVIRSATRHAAESAARKGVNATFSITTNGTLLTAEDADFFEDHGFAVTVSLDGVRDAHDRLRPFHGGRGSYELIMKRVRPLLARQRRMQVSTRVTVTPFNSGLARALDHFIEEGFHSVGFSPLLHSPAGQGEMAREDLTAMLEEMISCGLAYEEHVLRGEPYRFLNMMTALRELERGTHRPYPCGAGVGYFGVSAEGELSACHRFVGDRAAAFGHVSTGVDRSRQAIWLNARHVDAQQPCSGCWARYLCGGGCHHEVLARGRGACDYIRGWLHYTIQAFGRLRRLPIPCARAAA